MISTELNAEVMSDEEVVRQVLAGEITLFEILMRRHNQRLYRVARSILGDDSEAEDVIQDSYVRAYTHLPVCWRGQVFDLADQDRSA